MLRRLAADISELTTVAVDLFAVQTHGDLVLRIEAAPVAADHPIREPACELSAITGLSLGGLHAQLRLPARQGPDARMLFVELIRILVRAADRIPTLVLFDEFQSATEVAGATADLRTELGHHYDRLALLFTGSAPTTMRDICTQHDQPFCNQADLLDIGPLSRAAVHGILTRGFTTKGRDPGAVADLTFQNTAGHPQRTMRPAGALWRRTPPGERADDHLRAALREVPQAGSATLAATYEALTSNEREVARLVAHGQPLHGAASQRLELSAGGARHAYRRLLEEGRLHEQHSEVVVTGPLFADWLRRQLPLRAPEAAGPGSRAHASRRPGRVRPGPRRSRS